MEDYFAFYLHLFLHFQRFPNYVFSSFLKSSQYVQRLIFHVSDPWRMKFHMYLSEGFMLCSGSSGIVSARSQFSTVDCNQDQYSPSSSLFGFPRPITTFFYQRDLNFIVSICLKAIIVDVHSDSKHCDAMHNSVSN